MGLCARSRCGAAVAPRHNQKHTRLALSRVLASTRLIHRVYPPSGQTCTRKAGTLERRPRPTRPTRPTRPRPRPRPTCTETETHLARGRPAGTQDSQLASSAEGISLRVSDNKTGYFGVTYNNKRKSKPYAAALSHDGKRVSLGYFATAEEAALCIARSPEGQAAAAEAERGEKRRHRSWADKKIEAMVEESGLSEEELAQRQQGLFAEARQLLPTTTAHSIEAPGSSSTHPGSPSSHLASGSGSSARTARGAHSSGQLGQLGGCTAWGPPLPQRSTSITEVRVRPTAHPGYMRLQARLHTVAASITYGYRYLTSWLRSGRPRGRGGRWRQRRQRRPRRPRRQRRLPRGHRGRVHLLGVGTRGTTTRPPRVLRPRRWTR